MFPKAMRVVHYKDIVPHLPLENLGFWHIPTEVWLFPDDSSNYKVCTENQGEDPTCSDTTTIPNIPDHTCYYQINTGCDTDICASQEIL